MQSLATNFFFTLLVLLTVVPAILVVLTLNIVRAACWLLLSLTGAAGLFFYLGADFVGATQLLIYVGGTLVLVIFGVMLTATGPFVNLASRSSDWALGVVAGAALFGVLTYGLVRGDVERRPITVVDRVPQVTTNPIGLAFLGLTPDPAPTTRRAPPRAPMGGPVDPPHRASSYLLPFEIVSVHLVVVLIGAAYLARAKRRTQEVVG